jgi:hypothetical protein
MEPLQQVADLAPIVKGVVAGANDYVDDAGKPYSWPVPNYRIVMPRIGSRLTLEACRAEAMAIAHKEGIRGEPEVENYDGWHSSNGPLSNPQGYVFSWNEGHAGEVVAPLDDRKPS